MNHNLKNGFLLRLTGPDDELPVADLKTPISGLSKKYVNIDSPH